MKRAAMLLAGVLPLALAASPASAAKIFLNASDQTSNPVSCGGNEAQYAADEALRTKSKLQSFGFTVQYSQDFYNSPSMANSWGADRFLSIHSNAGGGHGTETLYKSSAGNTLAGHINNGIVAQLGFANRGLKYRDNLHMLNATAMPAALTEVLFHDCTTTHNTPIGNMSESCFLTKAAGRELAAEGMTQGFCALYGVNCTPAPPLPAYDATAATSSYPAAMTSGEEAVVWFEFVNQGGSTWDLDPTRLGTQDPQDRDSSFFVEGNWMSPSRATGADHSDYGTGSTGRFTFLIRAPEVDAETVFTETFQLVQEGVTWFGPKVTMTITVSPSEPPPPDDPPDDPQDPPGELPDGPGPAPGVEGSLALQDEDRSPGSITGGCALGSERTDGSPVALLVVGALLLAGGRRRRHHDCEDREIDVVVRPRR